MAIEPERSVSNYADRGGRGRLNLYQPPIRRPISANHATRHTAPIQQTATLIATDRRRRLTRLTYLCGHYKIVCNIIGTRLYETRFSNAPAPLAEMPSLDNHLCFALYAASTT